MSEVTAPVGRPKIGKPLDSLGFPSAEFFHQMGPGMSQTVGKIRACRVAQSCPSFFAYLENSVGEKHDLVSHLKSVVELASMIWGNSIRSFNLTSPRQKAILALAIHARG